MGSFYWVVVSAITVDAQTVNFIAAVFRIGPAEAIAGYEAVDVAAVSGDATAADNLELACDNYSVTRGLSGTALPAAAADAAGGLPISDAGGLDLDAQVGTKINDILTDTGTTLDALIKDVPTVAEFEARSLPAADYVVVGDTIAGVTTVGSVTDGVLLATDALSAAALKTDAVTEIVLAILKTDWTGIVGESDRSVLNALRFLRNKWSITGTTLTVTKENDTTAAWTSELSTDAAAAPVVGSDPA